VGGRPPYTCTLVSGTMPKGFSLSAACVVSRDGTSLLGSSTMLISAPFTVRMSDSSSPAQGVTFELRVTIVAKPPKVTARSGSCPEAGKACSIKVATATGGTPPYYFTKGPFGTGNPPLGMIVGLDGTLKGTPAKAGSYQFEVCAVDLVGASSCGGVTISVGSVQPTHAAADLPSGFPTNLPGGRYQVSMCVAAAGVTSMCSAVGTYDFSYQDTAALVEALTAAADSIRSSCACSTSFTSFNGTEFDLVIRSSDSTAVATIKIVKVG
jgi:hypothetical protein